MLPIGENMGDRLDCTSVLAVASGALQAGALEVQGIAFNIANISTSGFIPLRVDKASGFCGKGVRIDGVRRGDAEFSKGQNGRAVSSSETSGTDLATEITHLVETEKSFVANARVIGIADDLAGDLLDMKA